ncbi:MAG: NUDIX domain-containing protein [Chloroflexi bacterium]|nr:NUDIX domain-containing protein [Chloroflexota bacterium]
MNKVDFAHVLCEMDSATCGRSEDFLVYATVILVDDNGRFLLQQRTDFEAWRLPGGVLELDEDIRQCAQRELTEETGLSAGKLRIVGVYTHPCFEVVYPNGDHVQQYTVSLTGRLTGGVMQPDFVETSAQGFTRWRKVRRCPCCPGIVPCWRMRREVACPPFRPLYRRRHRGSDRPDAPLCRA